MGGFGLIFHLVLDQYARFGGEMKTAFTDISAKTSTAKSKNVHNYFLFKQIIAKLYVLCSNFFNVLVFYAWKLHDILLFYTNLENLAFHLLVLEPNEGVTHARIL
jgi:hypothetical protein